MEDRESVNEDIKNLESSHLKAKRPFFSCSLCHEKYKNPKVLNCWHSFCFECLSNYIPENSISVVCPLCNIPSIIPQQGVNLLPDNWMLTSLKDGKSPSVDLLTLKTSSRMLDTIDGSEGATSLQCQLQNHNKSNNPNNNKNNTKMNNSLVNITIRDDSQLTDNMQGLSMKHSENDSDSPTNNFSHTPPLSREGHKTSRQHCHDTQCDTASSSAIVMDESLTGETSQSAFFSQSYRSSSEFSNEKLYCRLHSLQNLDFYCQDCDVAICPRCSELGHNQHSIVSIDAALPNQKTILNNLIEQLKDESKDTENDKILIERVKFDLENSFNNVKDQINTRYQNIMELLQKKLNTNLQELNSIYKFRNNVLDKQLYCINENFENIQMSYDLTEKILDSERSELILLANKSYSFDDYSQFNESKQPSLKSLHSPNTNMLSRPLESSFMCFDPEGYENLEKYSSYLNGIVSDKSLCSNMISFSIEDLNKPIHLNRKFKLAIYLIEDNICIINDYLSRLNNAIYAILHLPNSRKKPIEFIKDTSNNKLGYMQFTPEQIGVHILELYNFGVLVRGTPLELAVTKFSLATNATPNHLHHLTTSKIKNSASKRQITQTQSQPKLKSTSSTFINKNIPSKKPMNNLNKQPPNTSNKLPQKTLAPNSSIKTSINPSQRHKSNTSLSRPPWNSSITKNNNLVPTTQPLRRSLSSTVPRNDLSHRLSNTSLHKLDKTAKLSSRITSHPAINNAFKERINNDCKMNLENKIDEEEDEENWNQNAFENQNVSYCRLHSNAVNKTLPLTKTIDSKPKRRITTLSHTQTRTTRQAGLTTRIPLEKPNTLRKKLSNDIFKKFGCKGKRLGEFNSLQDVAYHNGLLLGSDSKNQCIQVIDYNSGKFTKQILLGEGLLKVPSPSGLAVDSSGNMYVSDLDNHCVVVLDTRGRLLRKIGQTHLKGPKGLVLSDKELIVADMKGCSVYMYDRISGELLGRFGSQGYKDDNLCSPQFCALTIDQSHIIVSDFRTDKVKIFSKEGHLVKCFGSSGTRSGQLSGPTGLAVHPSSGNIYVCDFSNTRIQVFSKDGLFVEKLNLSLSAPQGLGFLDDKFLMVADAGNHCIKITKIKAT